VRTKHTANFPTQGLIYQGSAGRIRQPVESPAFATDSVTWMASMTKLVTATCVMQLVDRGLIKLDDDVRPLVPRLAKMQILEGYTSEGEDGKPILRDNPHPITLRHLLTHTTGLPYDIIIPDIMRWSQHVGRTVNNLSWTLDGFDTPLLFAPGEGWCYGTSIDWAGQVLESLTGLTLHEYARRNVLDPLGMARTGFLLDELLQPNSTEKLEGYVPGSLRNPETGELADTNPPGPSPPPVASGGAGLYGCAADYAKLLQALLKILAGSSEEVEGGGLVSKAAMDEMVRPQLKTDKQRADLKQSINMLLLTPELPADTPMDFGLIGAMNTQDVPGQRRKGSLTWSGICNSRWVSLLPLF
jgi:CubicO group peptidase (beta-lactamase class C family)